MTLEIALVVKVSSKMLERNSYRPVQPFSKKNIVNYQRKSKLSSEYRDECIHQNTEYKKHLRVKNMRTHCIHRKKTPWSSGTSFPGRTIIITDIRAKLIRALTAQEKGREKGILVEKHGNSWR